jgi:hypothetical protein
MLICHSVQAKRDTGKSRTCKTLDSRLRGNDIAGGFPLQPAIECPCRGRGRRLDTGLRRYDEFDDNYFYYDTVSTQGMTN